jgi:hypothetical protein
VFDLDQGGNNVEAESTSDDVHDYYAHSFQKVGNIWVPKTAIARTTNKRAGVMQEQRMTWTQNIVNEPVPESAFSLEKLAIAKGDLVRDLRSGAEYKYEGSSSPNDSARIGKFWSYLLVLGLIAVMCGFLIIAWRVRTNRRRRLGNASGS